MGAAIRPGWPLSRNFVFAATCRHVWRSPVSQAGAWAFLLVLPHCRTRVQHRIGCANFRTQSQPRCGPGAAAIGFAGGNGRRDSFHPAATGSGAAGGIRSERSVSRSAKARSKPGPRRLMRGSVTARPRACAVSSRLTSSGPDFQPWRPAAIRVDMRNAAPEPAQTGSRWDFVFLALARLCTAD